jgi:alpha-beta hydrolase superfamily lysophospholipase
LAEDGNFAMRRGLFGWTRRLLLVALSFFGLLVLSLAALIATPLSVPPPLESIYRTVLAVDRSDMPEVARFQARDGTELAYRRYAPRAAAIDRIAIVVHGSSGGSPAVHALAKSLAGRGIETYAVDMRGHGASGTRGDIAYVGQLEDDLADLVGQIRRNNASAPIVLLGHSAGGGFALRVAASPIRQLFARTILLAPYLGYDAPTNRPQSGGWANADIPRFLGIRLLHAVGIGCCDALPVLAFAVRPNSQRFQTGIYSYRLMTNFAVDRDYRRNLAAATRPITIMAGKNDELMLADNYAEAVRGITASVNVKLIDGVDHMGIVCDPAAVSAIADDVATTDLSS